MNNDLRQRVIRGLECCSSGNMCKGKCPYDELGCEWTDCVRPLTEDALALLKEQEPRVMTLHDWEANHVAKMPVWVEWRESARGECADYEKADGWAILNVDEFVDAVCFGGRCWTSRPTDEQRKATPWPEPPKEVSGDAAC